MLIRVKRWTVLATIIAAVMLLMTNPCFAVNLLVNPGWEDGSPALHEWMAGSGATGSGYGWNYEMLAGGWNYIETETVTSPSFFHSGIDALCVFGEGGR